LELVADLMSGFSVDWIMIQVRPRNLNTKIMINTNGAANRKRMEEEEAAAEEEVEVVVGDLGSIEESADNGAVAQTVIGQDDVEKLQVRQHALLGSMTTKIITNIKSKKFTIKYFRIPEQDERRRRRRRRRGKSNVRFVEGDLLEGGGDVVEGAVVEIAPLQVEDIQHLS